MRDEALHALQHADHSVFAHSADHRRAVLAADCVKRLQAHCVFAARGELQLPQADGEFTRAEACYWEDGGCLRPRIRSWRRGATLPKLLELVRRHVVLDHLDAEGGSERNE